MKWSGQRMRNEWMEIFSQEGYRFCKVKPEETGVFYKYYEEGFHLVMFIDGTNGYLPTMGQLQVMQERVQELFYHPVGRLQDFPEGFHKRIYSGKRDFIKCLESGCCSKNGKCGI